MGRLIWGLFILMAAAWPAAADEPFNVDFTIGWEGCYRPLEWTPVEIGVASNLKEPFGGAVVLTAKQDQTSMSVTHPIVVTADLPLRLPLVTKFSFGGADTTLEIVDDRGRVRWSYDYSMFGFSGSDGPRQTAVGVNDLLIGTVGKKGFGLGKLESLCGYIAVDHPGKVFVKDKLPQLLPWDWTGYVSLNVLVLYNPDWELINPHQAGAIAEWVQGGGRLLIVLGGNPLPANGPIAQLLPFRVGPMGKAQVYLSELLDQNKIPSGAVRTGKGDANRSQSVRQGKIPLSPHNVAAWELPEPNALGWRRTALGAEPVFASGPAGFGQVGVLAFDPAELGPDGALTVGFWAHCLNPVLKGEVKALDTMAGGVQSGSDSYQYDLGPAGNATNAVMEHLLSISELRPLSIWWVIGLLVLLAVLLGPVDYLLLKRLDRLPLTWVTSSLVIGVFTVGSYYGVQALRAGNMQVRAVTVIDAVSGGPAWSTSYCGIFAPASDEYRLEGLGRQQWWSAIYPTQNEYLYRYGRDEMAGRKLDRLQQDGGNLPTAVPINIWSMQCLVRQTPEAASPIDAEVTFQGDPNSLGLWEALTPSHTVRPGTPPSAGTKSMPLSHTDSTSLTLRITNRAACPISRGFVRLGKVSLPFGRVEPGATQEFSGSVRLDAGRESSLAWAGPDSEPELGPLVEQAFQSRGCQDRSVGISSYLSQGAAVVAAVFDHAGSPCRVAERKCDVNHVQVARLVIIPKGEQP